LENKPILQAAFAELATSNANPVVDLMTDDFCWVCTGTTLWSRRYAGKQAVLGELSLRCARSSGASLRLLAASLPMARPWSSKRTVATRRA
ncbi:hypothetical protein, partial [Staphylococcus aureus]|uniref:hypothetical protein n=1 Tax=Staphylococcus aureus TaxID=1280 RepID=UPI0032B4AAA4